MMFLTSKDGFLVSYFDEINEPQNGIKGSSSNKFVVGNHDKVADRGKVKGHSPL